MKPIVSYFKSSIPIEVGQRAVVYITSPHPVLGTVPWPKWVHTSPVLSIDDTGFETENTRYERDKPNESEE